MAAGMHEYAAMKALHSFVESGAYDVVVVDTPPSRHALDFLDAPERLQQLFDLRVMRVLRPEGAGFFRRLGASVALRTIQAVTGSQFAEDFVFFLTQFERVFSSFESGATSVRRLLSTDQASFVLVTSPQETSVDEAFLFQDKALKMHLPVGGFVFNRSSASLRDWEFPEASSLSDSVPGSMLERLQAVARDEQQRAARDLEVLRRVKARAGQGAFVFDLPLLEADDGDLHRLAHVSGLFLDGAGDISEQLDAEHRARA
jgi:anion-transporting  ArsA/GET3 family ATPase